MLVSTSVVHRRGLKSCEITPTRVCGVAATVYRREQGPRRFGQKLDSEDGGEHPERLVGRHVGDPLAHGEGPRLSTELPDRELSPCEGFLTRGSNED